jgi:hypothetical protein
VPTDVDLHVPEPRQLRRSRPGLPELTTTFNDGLAQTQTGRRYPPWRRLRDRHPFPPTAAPVLLSGRRCFIVPRKVSRP